MNKRYLYYMVSALFLMHITPRAQALLPQDNKIITAHIEHLKAYLQNIQTSATTLKEQLEKPDGILSHAKNLVSSCTAFIENAGTAAYHELVILAQKLQILQSIKNIDPNTILTILITTLTYLQLGIKEFVALQPYLLSIAALSVLVLSPQHIIILTTLAATLGAIQLILQQVQPYAQQFLKENVKEETIVGSLTTQQNKFKIPGINLSKFSNALNSLLPLAQTYMQSLPALEQKLDTAKDALAQLSQSQNPEAINNFCTQLNNFIYAIIPVVATTAQIIQNGAQLSKITGKLLQKPLVNNTNLSELLTQTISLTQQFQQIGQPA